MDVWGNTLLNPSLMAFLSSRATYITFPSFTKSLPYSIDSPPEKDIRNRSSAFQSIAWQLFSSYSQLPSGSIKAIRGTRGQCMVYSGRNPLSLAWFLRDDFIEDVRMRVRVPAGIPLPVVSPWFPSWGVSRDPCWPPPPSHTSQSRKREAEKKGRERQKRESRSLVNVVNVYRFTGTDKSVRC